MLPAIFSFQQELVETNYASPTLLDLNALPDLPLATVIRHLPWRDRVRMEQVSRRWRRLCLGHGWAHHRHFDTQDFIFEVEHEGELAEVLKRCGGYVESLKLRYIRQPKALLKRCSNFQRLSIQGVDLTETVSYLCQWNGNRLK